MSPFATVKARIASPSSGRRMATGAAEGQDVAQATARDTPLGDVPPPLIAHRDGMPMPEVVLIIALGLDEATLRQAIAQSTPTDPDEPQPLFLTDHVDFDPLTEHNHLFEHIPSAESQAMMRTDLPWDRYVQRRLNLLLLKWRPVSIIPLGKTSRQVLSTWRARNARRETT